MPNRAQRVLPVGQIPMMLTPRHYVAWTADDIAKLKELAQHYPASVIARELERTTPAIVRKARELRLSMRMKRPTRQR
jgi:hypothetical protein